MPKAPYPYEVNGKLVTGNGSLTPICSLSNHSLLPSLTVLGMYNFADQLKIPLNKLPSVGVMMGLSSHKAVVGAVVLGRSTVPEGVVTTTTLGGVMAT